MIIYLDVIDYERQFIEIFNIEKFKWEHYSFWYISLPICSPQKTEFNTSEFMYVTSDKWDKYWEHLKWSKTFEIADR